MKMTVYLLSKESVQAALNDFDDLAKLLKKHPKRKEIESKVRARAREILTYIWSSGLASSLTFYLAKGEENTVNLIKEVFNRREELIEEFEKLAPEKFAYAVILYLIFKRLKQLNFISGDPGDPRNCLRELIEMDPFRLMYTSNMLTLYLLEFKKLCEAAFEPER